MCTDCPESRGSLICKEKASWTKGSDPNQVLSRAQQVEGRSLRSPEHQACHQRALRRGSCEGDCWRVGGVGLLGPDLCT